MNNILVAKKTTGLDDIFKGYAPQQLEEFHKINHDQSPVALALQLHERALASPRMDLQALIYSSVGHIVLSPVELKTLVPIALMQLSLYLENITQYGLSLVAQGATDIFLVTLMQNSYDAGYNDFIVPNADERLELQRVHGKEDNLLRLTVEGNLGAIACSETIYGDITIKGKVYQAFAEKSKKSILRVGKAFDVGAKSEDCYFQIGEWTPRPTINPAKRCTFEIGKLNDPPQALLYAVDCTFAFRQQHDAQEFKKYIVSGNRIQYIKPNGSIDIVRDFDDAM